GQQRPLNDGPSGVGVRSDAGSGELPVPARGLEPVRRKDGCGGDHAVWAAFADEVPRLRGKGLRREQAFRTRPVAAPTLGPMRLGAIDASAWSNVRRVGTVATPTPTPTARSVTAGRAIAV